MGVFRTISATQRLYETNDLSALLKSCFHNRVVYVVRKERICRNHNMPTRNEYANSLFGEFREECLQRSNVCFIQDREPWKRASLATVE